MERLDLFIRIRVFKLAHGASQLDGFLGAHILHQGNAMLGQIEPRLFKHHALHDLRHPQRALLGTGSVHRPIHRVENDLKKSGGSYLYVATADVDGKK